MLLGRVTGTVVSTHKEQSIDGIKLLLVTVCDADGRPDGSTVVAADAVGAGVGEVVLFAAGSSARQTEVTNNRPVDHTIMAIVDAVEVDGQQRYRKA